MRKRFVVLLLMCTLFFCCFPNVGTAFAGQGKGKNQGNNGDEKNCVLFAEKVTVNGKTLAKPEVLFDRAEVKNNLLGKLGSETELKDTLSIGAKDIKVNQATYVKSSVSLSGTDVTISKPLVAKNDITISATNVTVTDTAFLLSVEGNINIYCTNLSVNGTLCAKNKAFFTGSKANVNEAVFASTIEFYMGAYQSDNTVNETVISADKNLLAGLSVYEEDGVDYLYGNSNFEFVSMDVYGRKAKENSFELIQENVTGEMVIPSCDSYCDYAAVLINSFGFAFKADPVSVTEEDGILFCAYGEDDDGDGVTNAYEIWLAGTNPHIPDDFPNPEFYVYLKEYEGTTCYDRLLRRDVSFSTQDYTKNYEYDDESRISKVVVRYQDGTSKQIRYDYDENNRVKNLFFGDNKYTITEDGTSVRYFINGTLVKFVTKSGLDSTVNYFDDAKEVYTYDEADNLISYRNGTLYEMTYDELDLMVGLSKNGIPYGRYSYDDYGDYVTIDTTDYAIRYTYEYPLYQTDYSFGDIRKTHKVNCKDDAYEYGDILQLTDGTTGDAIPKAYVGEILSSDVANRTLSYRIGTANHTVRFNSRGYVVGDTVTDGTDEMTTVYSYDAYGNILQVKTSRNGQEEIHDYEYSSVWSDELISFDGNAITYDALGKPVGYYNGATLDWAAGKLSGIETEVYRASYCYGFTGLRDEKIVNGVTIKYIYEGRDLIAELSEDPLFFTYDGNFNLVGFERNGQAYYYQYDIFGDVVGIVDEKGETLCTYSYDLWGEIISIAGDVELAKRNPIRYRGYYYDSESGLYYLETRYYDPHIKRFISYDDLESFFYGEEEDAESLFVYCGNNPVEYVDYNGRRKIYVCGYTLKDWKGESNRFLDNLVDEAMERLGVGACSFNLCTLSSTDQFVSAWNSMNQKEIVFINSHGGPTLIADGGEGEFDFRYSNFGCLNRKPVQVLILLGCNCGHYDYANSNMAKGFRNKITGSVVAADGSVDSTPLINGIIGQASFKAVFSNVFKGYVIRAGGDPMRGPKGWLIYTTSGAVNTFGSKTIKASTLISYLITKGYLR